MVLWESATPKKGVYTQSDVTFHLQWMCVFVCKHYCETDMAPCTRAPRVFMNNDQSLPLSVSDWAIVCKASTAKSKRIYNHTHMPNAQPDNSSTRWLSLEFLRKKLPACFLSDTEDINIRKSFLIQ